MANFGAAAGVKYNRSRMDMSHGVKTTMSIGRLYPLKVMEVLPGDTFKFDSTSVVRCTSTFIKPIIDNLFMDEHAFYVPYRLLYDDYEYVYGNPKPSAYSDNDLGEFPTLARGEVIPGTVGDYLSLPVKINDTTKRYVRQGVSVLDFRAFAKIYNEWFRNENTEAEMYISTGERTSNEVYNNNDWSANNYFGKLPFVSKKKDYFTACLPNTQKGAPVSIPFSSGIVPVVTDLATHSNEYPVIYKTLTDGNPARGSLVIDAEDPSSPVVDSQKVLKNAPVTSSLGNISQVAPANLWASVSNANISVNDLRTAVQLQRMLEKDARYGSRINEYILGHFGVYTKDARIQFTEYLGGARVPISIQEVMQTSESTNSSPLGMVGANSISLGKLRFTKGFTEPGLIVIVGTIKQLHTYQQGIPRHMMRSVREDFYDPCLANISEQPVYKSQLFGYDEYSNGEFKNRELKQGVFGYNEAWADYRYEPSVITGQMRSGLSNSLAVWHLGDYFDEAPTLSSSFTRENSANIDRVLAVETTSQDNFLVDIWNNVEAIRVMPVYSVPGLVDHH